MKIANTMHFEALPYSVEAEQMLLGALISNPSILANLVARGGVELFHDPLHRVIFEVVSKKSSQDQLVSPVTVQQALKGVEGAGALADGKYIALLVGTAPASASTFGYVDMLADLKRKRELAIAVAEAQAAIAGGDEGADSIAGRLEAALVASQPSDAATGPVSMFKAASTGIDQSLAAYRGEDTRAVRSGIGELDSIVGGFHPGELILLGGRPSMGKTAVALGIALNVARAGHGVCIASLEMNPEALALRALSETTARLGNAVSYANLRRGEMSEAQARSAVEALDGIKDLPLMFLPRNYADIGALMAGAKQTKRIMGDNLRLFIVDYAQLLRSSARGRYEQITEISIALKSLAGQLNIPVLALSQLSRNVEQRDDKRPIMADLRESGQLEQDADTVLFCYRDEYYLEREKPSDEPERFDTWCRRLERSKNRLEIIVAKQRQGEIGTAYVRFNPGLNLIWEDRK